MGTSGGCFGPGNRTLGDEISGLIKVVRASPWPFGCVRLPGENGGQLTRRPALTRCHGS